MKAKKILASLLASAMVIGTMAVPVFAADGVAKIGDTEYATLQAAIDSVADNNQSAVTITLLKDVADGSGLATDSTDADAHPKNIIIDFGGYTYTMKDSSVGSTGTKTQALHFGQNSTVTMKNGTFKIAPTATSNAKMILQNYANLTLENIIIDGTDVALQTYSFEPSSPYYDEWNGKAIPIFNNNSGGTLTINEGTKILSHSDAVYGIISDTVINGGEFSGKFDVPSNKLTVKGGTFSFDPSDYVAEGYKAVQNGNGTWTVSEATAAVAKIGETTYATLQDAMDAVQNGEEIVLLADVTQNDGYKFNRESVSAKLDLNGKTITVNTGSNVNNRAIRIDNGTLEVCNGKIVAVGSGTTSANGTGCYGAFRVEANGKLNAHDLNLSNARPWGLNVKVLGGEATLTNVNITSSYGGGIEVTEADLGTGSKAGTATLTNCNFTQTGYYDHCSTPLSVSGGSELNVNSGTYTSENYVLYVFSSGGDINVKGGTFKANGEKPAIKAAIDLNTYPNYTGGLKISGGDFTGTYDITSPAYMKVSGGTFSEDPHDYLASGKSSAEDGSRYKIINTKTTRSEITEAVVKSGDDVTIKSATVEGFYDQVTATMATITDGIKFKLNVSGGYYDGTEKVITLTNENFSGTGSVVCGLIITDIPDTVTVTTTIVE